MYVAVRANVRKAAAAQRSLSAGLSVAFSSGSIMGMAVVSFSLVGMTLLYLLFNGDPAQITYITGFGFGASSIALFARVGGGIYTKAADVGADLVGKVEQGIPEDDPLTPPSLPIMWAITSATWPAWAPICSRATADRSSPPPRWAPCWFLTIPRP